MIWLGCNFIKRSIKENEIYNEGIIGFMKGSLKKDIDFEKMSKKEINLYCKKQQKLIKKFKNRGD